MIIGFSKVVYFESCSLDLVTFQLIDNVAFETRHYLQLPTIPINLNVGYYVMRDFLCSNFNFCCWLAYLQ